MALNPIVYTEKVSRSFLRYQLTAYPFADRHLNDQMRRLLSLDETRNSPLMKGPFISLSRSFRRGSSVEELVQEGVFHPHMRQRMPANITHVYGHQDEAIRAIHSGKTTLVSTGTGSGKSECFLYPIISKCLELRDAGEAAGISAVIVYPMNALAEDQLGRLRGLLAGTGITFGMYVGKTPETESEVGGIRMPANSTREAYEARVAQIHKEKRSDTVHPHEEVCSREIMRTSGGQPRILLTNVKQLELLLTRQKDVELFHNARLDFLVFDEAHTFTGANGAETACLIRRLRTYCGRGAQDTVCIATSATIVDKNNPDAARDFASRFFGVSATDIVTVNEAYEPDVWDPKRSTTPAPAKPAEVLQTCVVAVDADRPEEKVSDAYRDLSRQTLPAGEWQQALFKALSGSSILYELSEVLSQPRALSDIPGELRPRIGRDISEEEVLAWLTLGAAARNEERPLVRPVVHVFVKGIGGAVVSFPVDVQGPQLYLAAEDELAERHEEKHAHFPVSTCTTCGQHYFETALGDFTFVNKQPEGGVAADKSFYWPAVPRNLGGTRTLLVDHLISESDNDQTEDNDRLHRLFFCRSCGTAHPEDNTRCLQCGLNGQLVPLFAVKQKEDRIGQLSSCVSCKASGRLIGSTYREPARPVRATQVADVHVLAQDMVQHAERKRLLIFSDNRQDAAFQAGWMRDHARRFRLRALMCEALKEGGASIGDVSNHLNDVLENDDVLSRILIPEVWAVQRKEGTGGRHESERRKFLRMQVLREVVTSSRQALGLEPWGRMKIEYQGLHSSLRFIQDRANALGLPPDDLRDGIATVLDYLRRKRIVWDADYKLFSKIWGDGDLEIQQGYFPNFGSPEGTKLRKDQSDKTGYVTQWLSTGGDTTLKQMARSWGVESKDVESFLEELFQFFVSSEQPFLVPVTLRGSKDKPLPFVHDVYQVNGDIIRLHAHHGVYRCDTCQRRTPRRTPHMKCPAWRCNGELAFMPEERDNYNLQLLDQRYDMIRPEEHTAMIPNEQRERLENLFRGDSEAVNALVCTPTLELGVDIGQLDMVLMRNVPPLPANYWQRAGRAGRRHRMAVDVTYCRTASHDRAYFADPLKLLMGRVDPPSFNLSNEVMVSKHVHALMLTRLHQYVRDESKPQLERNRIAEVIEQSIPDRVSTYLFDKQGAVRIGGFDFADLEALISRNLDDLTEYAVGAFQQGWPEADSHVVTETALRTCIASTVSELTSVIERLRRRLMWAIGQIDRLNRVRAEQGTLETEDDALFRRCDEVVKRLKGKSYRGRNTAEGFDDVNTFAVLAAEGFLPGYGLESGSIVGTATLPHWKQGSNNTLSIPRPPSVALREFVPGNMIYTNSNKFVARRFHRDIDEQQVVLPFYEFSAQRMAVQRIESASAVGSMSSATIAAISVCDVELVHTSSIHDDEELRFQMGVNIYGYEVGQHQGGVAYNIQGQIVQHRKNVKYRLVNVGATSAMQRSQPEHGYPVCTVCGQSVSPLASAEQLRKFREHHSQRCGKQVNNIAFYADIVANSLTFVGLANQKIAYSVLEALRIASSNILDMDVEDLQILVIGHVEHDAVDGVLWDPMPGGSGLLDQFVSRYREIVSAALELLQHCPSDCASSCIDCLQTFRNSFYHPHLDRHIAIELFNRWGDLIVRDHDIPILHPVGAQSNAPQPVNDAERLFRELTRRAGLTDGVRGEQIRLGNALGTTTPDVIYRHEDDGPDSGLLVYIDGMSAAIHGNPERKIQDRQIREWLENNGYEVLVITAHELADYEAMRRYINRIAQYLGDNETRRRVKQERDWFDASFDSRQANVVEFVIPEADERYTSAVPFVQLSIAAGLFGDRNYLEQHEHRWVRYSGTKTLHKGMFVAKVTGRSMEPDIPDGAYCLFSSPVEGSRNNKTVVVQLLSDHDPETGERFTIKKYYSEKQPTPDGDWTHSLIMLKPVNNDFEPIVIEDNMEGRIQVIAELVEVL